MNLNAFWQNKKLNFTSQNYYTQKHWCQHFFAIIKFAHICIRNHYLAFVAVRISLN